MSSIYLPDTESDLEVMDSATIADPESFVIPILRRADFAFAGRQNMIQSGVIAQGVEASAFSSGVLMVLTHARNDWQQLNGATASFSIDVHNVHLDPDDPAVEVIESGRTVASQTAVNATSPVPRLQTVFFTPPIASQLRVSWEFRQGANQASVALTLAVSVYLIGRRAI